MSDYDATMVALFQEAEAKRLWFYTPYQGMWFSPRELREHHAHGKFRWGPVNWQLRDPHERTLELVRAIVDANQCLQLWTERTVVEAVLREGRWASEPSAARSGPAPVVDSQR